jgi:hypothetical protein
MSSGDLREFSLLHCDEVNAGAKPAKCESTAIAHR